MPKQQTGFVNKLVNKIYSTFEKDSGNMILATSSLGLVMSCVAQVAAIIVNDKYSVSQKAFMIPQELSEGAISVCSLLITTLFVQNAAKKYVESGKLLTKDLNTYLKKNNLKTKRGVADFSISAEIKRITGEIKSGDKFVKSSEAQKTAMLKEHQNALISLEQTMDATSAITTTAGSVISTALFVPLIRNFVASKYQKQNMTIINNVRERQKCYKNHVEKPNDAIMRYNSSLNRNAGMRL